MNDTYIIAQELLQKNLEGIPESRIINLYRFFKSRSINPLEYDAQYTFWCNLIKKLEERGVKYFSKSNLSETLSWNNFLPPLVSVLDQLVSERFILQKNEITDSFISRVANKIFDFNQHSDIYVFSRPFYIYIHKLIVQIAENVHDKISSIYYFKEFNDLCIEFPSDIVTAQLKKDGHLCISENGYFFKFHGIFVSPEKYGSQILSLKGICYYLSHFYNAFQKQIDQVTNIINSSTDQSQILSVLKQKQDFILQQIYIDLIKCKLQSYMLLIKESQSQPDFVTKCKSFLNQIENIGDVIFTSENMFFFIHQLKCFLDPSDEENAHRILNEKYGQQQIDSEYQNVSKTKPRVENHISKNILTHAERKCPLDLKLKQCTVNNRSKIKSLKDSKTISNQENSNQKVEESDSCTKEKVSNSTSPTFPHIFPAKSIYETL